jgi:hypothetical protein
VKAITTMRKVTALLASVGIGALIAALIASNPAGAATASSSTNLFVSFAGGDVLANYDHGTAANPNSRSGVDWTTTMFFKNNATVNKVKSVLGSSYSYTGSPAYAYLNDGSGAAWDADSGRKDLGGCNYIDDHMRIYADSDDRLYNTTDGYYVIASTHRDYWESSSNCGEYFGYSETTSADFRSYFVGQGYSCAANAVGIGNAEPLRYDGGGTHIWENDGNLHRCVIP